MNKYNLKILISLIVIFSFCIFVAAILTQNNFINDDPRVNQPSIDVFKLGLNDNPQESENRSTYQKFQEFWTEVFSEDAINWSYLDWRNYIILQIYGTTEDNLNSTIKSDPLFENNIDIFTIYVMGKYNGLLSDEDITNLKSQLMHNSVHIGDISFLNHDDTQFKLFINIEVESSPSMWYVADHIEIYLKSENSSGKWYDELGTHYVKVFDRSSLELTDPIPTDGNYKNHIVGPININTNTIEENVSLLAKVDYFTNFLMDEYVEKLELFNIVDDDESPPEISYTYTGDYTDGNPGELITSALDASGLSVDPSGTYSIPNSLGAYKFTFNATDADNDRPGDMLNSTITVWINITDDDVSYPDLSFVYTGDYTDGNPGELIVNASDFSGLSLDPSGIYQVPSEIGNYKFIFTACDADIDRFGDMLNSTITVWINITDDDISPPELCFLYTGDYTDGNPGELIVNASDLSGLSLDPSGIYQVPSEIGNYKFIFTACDADIDRFGDMLNSTITLWINITDDDVSYPDLYFVYTGDYTDGNPGELIVNASDFSGLFLDPSGIYQIPSEIGNYKFIFTACDADIDRFGDMLNSTITVWINITDDDVSYPDLSFVYTGDYTDGNPGELIVNASDFSGLSLDSSGIYQVPSEIGNYKFIFTAYDADLDRPGDMLNTTITVWINITDDDISPPELCFLYTGDYTDGNPGELIVNASDFSGLSLDSSGIYQIPSEIGNYKFIFTAYDADLDRLGDMLNSTITVWINITDDDVSYPDLSFVYTGDYTDGNPGELIVNASDLSGLSLDPSGIYQVPSEIGNYKFIFTACDADTDRLGDMLNTTITVWITIIDDDDEGPLINMVKIRNNRVYDYYEFLVIDILAEDKSGISELYLEFNGTKFYDDNGDNQILIENPRIPGMLYFFSIVAIDADNDREGDQKITQMVSSFEVFDDDSTPPEIFLYYDDINYQITILDNDGIFDSKATGKIFLIDEEGVILQSGVISQEDFNYTIPIPLKPGNYNLEVYTTNNDLEWNGDEEINYEVFSVIVDLEGCFKRVDTLLKDLIDYVDENLYLIIADNIRFKLCLAREYLMDAYILVNKEALNHGLFNELVIQGIIEFVEFETDFYSKFDLITEEIRNEIILYLHQIRNFVILLIGSSVDYAKGINCGFDIASIEVELLNLADIIKEELGDYSTQYLEKLVKLSALQLELAVIKLSRGIDPDSSLSVAQKFIDRAMEEVNNLVESIKIYEGIASYLLERLNNCYINIEEILRR
jgi:hypothetical protein